MHICPRVIVRPGLLINLLACSAAGYGLLYAFRIHEGAVAGTSPGEGLLAGSLALGAVLLHEAAHALAGAATGRRVEKVVLGLSIGVHSSGDSTPVRRAVAVGAGPVAEILTGLALWLASGGTTDAVLAAAVITVCNGCCNLLPVGRTDGAKLLRFLRLAASTRTLPCLPDACPACDGVTSSAAQP